MQTHVRRALIFPSKPVTLRIETTYELTSMKNTPITKEALSGIWAALPIPWKEDLSFDPDTFARDISGLCEAGVSGVYTGGTTGELYTQDFEMFCQVNRVMAKSVRDFGVPMQAGCTALSTEQVCHRVRYACDIGADIVQVALPFWLELDDAEVVEFFVDVAAAAGRTPIVHYDTSRSKRRVSAELYQVLTKNVPTLWGTKFGGSDIHAVKQITMANPELKVFVGEHILASSTPMGATGSYSSVVLVNPTWMVDYFEACRDHIWDRAFEIQDEICLLFSGLQSLPTPGLQDTAIDRIFGRLNRVLECPIYSKAPYRYGSQKDLDHMRKWVEIHLPHVLLNENVAVRLAVHQQQSLASV